MSCDEMEIKLCVKYALPQSCRFGNFLKLQKHNYLKNWKWQGGKQKVE